MAINLLRWLGDCTVLLSAPWQHRESTLNLHGIHPLSACGESKRHYGDLQPRPPTIHSSEFRLRNSSETRVIMDISVTLVDGRSPTPTTSVPP